MRTVRVIHRIQIVVGLALAAVHNVPQAQRDFRVYENFEGHSADAELPPDLEIPGELAIGRLMYSSGYLFCDRFFDSSSEHARAVWYPADGASLGLRLGVKSRSMR